MPRNLWPAQALFIGRRIAGGGGLEHWRSIALLSQENKIYHERTRKLLTEHTETLRRLDSTIGREHDKAKPPPSPPSPPPPITLKPASWAPPPGGLRWDRTRVLAGGGGGPLSSGIACDRRRRMCSTLVGTDPVGR